MYDILNIKSLWVYDFILKKYFLRDTWSSDQKKKKPCEIYILDFQSKIRIVCAITANVGIFCEQEAHTPHRSPEKQFKSINAFAQRYYNIIAYILSEKLYGLLFVNL